MPKHKSIQARRPKTELRKVAPIICEFDVDGERRSLELRLTQQSYNELARTEDADTFAALLGRMDYLPCPSCDGRGKIDGEECWKCHGRGSHETREEALMRICGPWKLMRMAPAMIHAATGHMDDEERPTIDDISSWISSENMSYYQEIFGMLQGRSDPEVEDEEENPTSAGKPANGATSSTSTGREESPKLDFSSGLQNENLPN